eukprot:TRINITY_DN3724_c0_g1_i1.p1 TRINITY_DN3724_c0_g1~~TRINITY_DN3724_c0_g1_i1.p1  ORF type:complete len:451 (+),score=80.53 TRINITY_DN3724_c0_g1_i1:77-1429(+)
MFKAAATLCVLWLSPCAFAAEDKYVLIVDAGSSGSRMRMFKETSIGLEQVVPTEEDEASFETEPGLSAYVDNPSSAGSSLSGIIGAAKAYIPQSMQSSTPIFVKATAGMRLLEAAQARAVFESVTDFLQSSSSPFAFGSARILSGEEEALFGFLSVNMLLGSMENATIGAMDYGGASQQVTFIPKNMIRDGIFPVYIGDELLPTYTKSYMRFGQDQAILRSMEALVKAHKAGGSASNNITHPCYNTGYVEENVIGGETFRFVGSSEPDACSDLVRGLLLLDIECLMAPCAIFGTHMPAIGDQKFRAFSANFYAVNGIGLVGWNSEATLSPKQIKEAAIPFCSKNISAAQAVSGGDTKYVKNYCFSAMMIVHVMKAFGFTDDAMAVIFSRKIAGKSADWTMGAALYETQLMPIHFHEKCRRETTTCASLKSHYRDHGCCGNPTKTIPGHIE